MAWGWGSKLASGHRDCSHSSDRNRKPMMGGHCAPAERLNLRRGTPLGAGKDAGKLGHSSVAGRDGIE